MTHYSSDQTYNLKMRCLQIIKNPVLMLTSQLELGFSGTNFQHKMGV